ncbi:MAG: hypothetical protein BM564_04400 [Bacteroidetes bacterium MedPE-SWsnd-G2]|nr:MAG: hypothetical protein BM564_04400 [Bacteroidetes bacterium MedPE-SWsnd-G2]
MSTPTIPIKDAQDLTKNWQTHNPNFAKAFLIPINDILACINESGVDLEIVNGRISTVNPDESVRAYVGVKDSQKAEDEKLLIVATFKDGSEYVDICENGANPPGGRRLYGSGVFDFTKPCPNECNRDSPLFHD